MEGLESFFTVSEQLKLFLLSCLFGVPIGIVFDVFRTLRIIFPHGKIIVMLEDILFFAMYGVFLMSFTIATARSEFRVYFCIGNFIGFVLYYFTVGNIMVNVIRIIFTFLKRVLCVIFCPIGKRIVLLYEKNRDFFCKSLQNAKIRKKNSQTPLIVECDLLYNNKVSKKNKKKEREKN